MEINKEIDVNVQKKDTIKLISLVYIFLSALISSSVGLFFSKYLLKDFENQAMLNIVLLVFIVVVALIQSVAFIIVMLLFYQLLKVLLGNDEFGSKVSAKQFISDTGCFSIIGGMIVLLLSVIVSIKGNYLSMPIEIMQTKWKPVSDVISIFSKLMFLISIAIYYSKKTCCNISKIKLFLSFLAPYITFITIFYLIGKVVI
ncbi:MAG: hypothetical protein AB6733_20550 [Clostridiaceae bacterium]